MRSAPALLLMLAACGSAEAVAVSPPPPAASAPAPAEGPEGEPPRDPRRVRPGDLVVLVVDRSGSMSGVPMEAAKQALLDAPSACPTCRIEVIVFDSSFAHVATYEPGSPRVQYDTKIKKIQPGGGTDGVPALGAATKLLAKEPKGGHVVFFTDGQFPTDDLPAALADLRKASGTLSTIGLGGVDGRTLLRMATQGKGRFHHVRDVEKLRDAFRLELGGD